MRGSSPTKQLRVEGVAHRSVTLDGFDAHVASAGDLDGEPVVLIHGWPLHWSSFRHLIRALAEDGRRVLAPDLRGFGWSGTPGRGYAPPQFTADLFALLDTLGLEEVDLVGHAQGGRGRMRGPRLDPQRPMAAPLTRRLEMWGTWRLRLGVVALVTLAIVVAACGGGDGDDGGKDVPLAELRRHLPTAGDLGVGPQREFEWTNAADLLVQVSSYRRRRSRASWAPRSRMPASKVPWVESSRTRATS